MNLLEVENLVKHFPVAKGWFGRGKQTVYAVNGVSFSVAKGETLGVVGESGSGKSTMGRSVLRLIEPTSGRVRLEGVDVTSLNGENLRKARKHMQMIFQDPYASLNPRLTIGNILEEPLKYHGVEKKNDRREQAERLLREVGLDDSYYDRFPFQFSGGQRQRVGIARALALNPKLIIADEPVSALDVSIQAQVLNLFVKLQETRNLTYVFISHDLSVVKHLCNRIAVMYLGEIVEMAECEELFRHPLHPYTQALIRAIPVVDPAQRRQRLILTGDIPSQTSPPAGCPFHTRCPQCMDICKKEHPALLTQSGHQTSCHLYGKH